MFAIIYQRNVCDRPCEQMYSSGTDIRKFGWMALGAKPPQLSILVCVTSLAFCPWISMASTTRSITLLTESVSGATRPFTTEGSPRGTEMQSGNVEHRIELTKQHPATRTPP